MERALGAAQVLAGEVGVVRRPRKLVIGSPKPVIFQRGLGRGEGEWTGGAWKDRAQQRPGRNLRRLVSQAPLGGLENRPLGRWRGGGCWWAGQGALECAKHPQTPLASCSDAKDSRGHTAPGSISARRPPPGREVAGPRRDTGPCVPSPTLRAGVGGWARWAPGEGRGGMRAAGGSFGTRGERDSRPVSRRRTPEPGDPAIDSNREAAVYRNTAPPGPSPGDAARPGAPSAWRGRSPSSLPRGPRPPRPDCCHSRSLTSSVGSRG